MVSLRSLEMVDQPAQNIELAAPDGAGIIGAREVIPRLNLGVDARGYGIETAHLQFQPSRRGSILDIIIPEFFIAELPVDAQGGVVDAGAPLDAVAERVGCALKKAEVRILIGYQIGVGRQIGTDDDPLIGRKNEAAPGELAQPPVALGGSIPEIVLHVVIELPEDVGAGAAGIPSPLEIIEVERILFTLKVAVVEEEIRAALLVRSPSAALLQIAAIL